MNTILNLYAGIGGNRKNWGDEYKITAVEIDPKIAAIYNDLYPKDEIIVGDAHEYLLKNYEKYSFIWSSPPCPTHSITNNYLNAQGVKRYPDMQLYQEIILLSHFYKGKFCIENVKSYYNPLIKPQLSGRHYFWANFFIPNMKGIKIGRMGLLNDGTRGDKKENLNKLGFDLKKYKHPNKEKLLRNCVSPEIGAAILDQAFNVIREQKIPQAKLNFNV